jgi:hypothetical protein
MITLSVTSGPRRRLFAELLDRLGDLPRRRLGGDVPDAVEFDQAALLQPIVEFPHGVTEMCGAAFARQEQRRRVDETTFQGKETSTPSC